jgi:diacylglycerol kinase family enzyme
MNPTSRSGKGRKLWPAWESELRRANIRFNSVVTKGPGDAFRISKASRNGDTLVAVGGDGTINEVLDGISQSGDPTLSMGVLYSGTSPDFCRFHDIPTESRRAIQCLLNGNINKVDVVKIEYENINSVRQISHFACGCNIGMGASIASFANRHRKFLGDRLGTGLGVLHAVLRSIPLDLDLEIDGVEQRFVQVNHLSILKSPYIASGLKLNLPLRSDDGKMALVGVHGKNRAGLCGLLPGFYSGKAVNSDAVFIQECSRICIRSATSQDIEFDGDPRGSLPINVQIRPRSLRLIGGAHD